MLRLGEVKDKNIQVEGHGYRVRVHWQGELRPCVLGLHETIRKAQEELLEYPRDCYEGSLALTMKKLDNPKRVYRLVE